MRQLEFIEDPPIVLIRTKAPIKDATPALWHGRLDWVENQKHDIGITTLMISLLCMLEICVDGLVLARQHHIP